MQEGTGPEIPAQPVRQLLTLPPPHHQNSSVLGHLIDYRTALLQLDNWISELSGAAVSPPGNPMLGPGSCQLSLFHSEEDRAPSPPASLWLPPGALIWGMVSCNEHTCFLPPPQKAFGVHFQL